MTREKIDGGETRKGRRKRTQERHKRHWSHSIVLEKNKGLEQ